MSITPGVPDSSTTPPAADHPPTNPVGRLRAYRILVFEDHDLNREVLQRRLMRKGYDVRSAADGLEGLSMAETFGPDLILMDLGLPEVDGWECLRRLRANSATRAIPIIVLTAHAFVGDRDRALAAGCDDFDTKPIDFARLLIKMQHLLPRD
jgi:two-component system, cell cycle response regulator DivK